MRAPYLILGAACVAFGACVGADPQATMLAVPDAGGVASDAGPTNQEDDSGSAVDACSPGPSATCFRDDFEHGTPVAATWDDEAALLTPGASATVDADSDAGSHFANLSILSTAVDAGPKTNQALLNKTLQSNGTSTASVSFRAVLPIDGPDGPEQTVRYFAFKAGLSGGVGLFRTSSKWFVQVFGVSPDPTADFVMDLDVPPPLGTWTKVLFTAQFDKVGGSIALSFDGISVVTTSLIKTLGPDNAAKTITFDVGPRQEAGPIPATNVRLDDVFFTLR